MDKVSGDEGKAENYKNILAVQVKYPNMTMRVIVAHSAQETNKQEVRQRFFYSLKLEVERGHLNDDAVIIMGDMNGRIEIQNEEIVSTSPNGMLLREVILENNLKVANYHPSASGFWTRIQHTKQGTKKSAIDFCLVDDNNYHNVKNVIIDECKASESPLRKAKNT